MDMSFDFNDMFLPSQEDRLAQLEYTPPMPDPVEDEELDNRSEILRDYPRDTSAMILSSMAGAGSATSNKDLSSRYWFFTWNMGQHESLEDMKHQVMDYPSRWTIVAKERGTRNGRRHLQGAFYFKSDKKWSTLVKQFPGIWIVPAKGTAEQIRKYCNKEDEHCYEMGDPPVDKREAAKRGGEATKEKYKTAFDIMIEGGDITTVEPELIIKHLPNLCKIKATLGPIPPDLDTPQSFWYFGKPGTGKSSSVRKFCEDSELNLFSKPLEDQWWDEMPSRTSVTILDDFDVENKALGRQLKIWADQYKFVAQIKGVKSLIRPSHFFVTSNYHPNEIWSGKMLEALSRRFKVKFFYRTDEELNELPENWIVHEKIKVDFELNTIE